MRTYTYADACAIVLTRVPVAVDAHVRAGSIIALAPVATLFRCHQFVFGSAAKMHAHIHPGTGVSEGTHRCAHARAHAHTHTHICTHYTYRHSFPMPNPKHLTPTPAFPVLSLSAQRPLPSLMRHGTDAAHTPVLGDKRVIIGEQSQTRTSRTHARVLSPTHLNTRRV